MVRVRVRVRARARVRVRPRAEVEVRVRDRARLSSPWGAHYVMYVALLSLSPDSRCAIATVLARVY